MTLSENSFKKLQKIVGKPHCSRSKADRVCYAYDATAQVFLPDAVVFPKDRHEIAAILFLANKENFFVTPRGSGSGMTGGALAVNGGVILVTTRLNRILEINRNRFISHVEPGVVTGRFHQEVEKQGLFYPPDPARSEFSTLGGNLAECAGGPRAVKYGVTRDYVLGLEAVLPTGEMIKTGVQTTKGVVGYDLTRLLVGSEGTLGVITRMTLRLLPLPETTRTMTAVFDQMEVAAETVSEIIRRGIIPRTMEYMDNASLRCVEDYLGIGLPREAEALLLLEVDGSEMEVDSGISQLKSLCLSMGATGIRIAENEAERMNLWKARKAISPALYRLGPDKINEDIVVPRDRIPDMVRKINTIRESTGLPMATFGHAGDGNIHFNLMIDKKNKKALEEAEAIIGTLFDYTLELGGSISGEHGVGITKAPYIDREVGQTELALMKKIKAVFDPKGILNPGKIFNTG